MMHSGIQSTLPRLLRGLQSAAIGCAAGLMVLLSPAETPPAGLDLENEAKPPSRPRTFNSRITMHEVGSGPGRIPDQEEKPSTDDYFREKFLAPSFGSPLPPSSYSMPVRPGPDRPKKDAEKKKNWITPKSNVDGLGLGASEEEGFLGEGDSLGWLVDSVLKDQEEKKQVQAETEDDLDPRQEAESEWDSDFEEGRSEQDRLSDEEMEAYVLEQLRTEDGQAAGPFQEETYRPLVTSYSVENISDIDQSVLSIDEDPHKGVQPGQEAGNSRWNSAAGNKDLTRPLQSRLTELNQAVGQSFSTSQTRSDATEANAYQGTRFQSGAFQPQGVSTRPGFSRGGRGFDSDRYGRSGLRSSPRSSPGMSPTLSRSTYSLPSSSGGLGTLKSGSPQSPLQSYQPLDDQRR